MAEQLTAARLRELFIFDHLNGTFRWRRGHQRINIGDVAGTLNDSHGYWIIGVDGKTYRRSRLVWLYVHGRWPVGDIDHKDLIRHHDWISNLRPATQTQNNANRRKYRNNKSGFKGVYFCKNAGKWRAMIRKDRKGFHIGLFSTPEEAHAAYIAQAQLTFGEFFRAA